MDGHKSFLLLKLQQNHTSILACLVQDVSPLVCTYSPGWGGGGNINVSFPEDSTTSNIMSVSFVQVALHCSSFKGVLHPDQFCDCAFLKITAH